MKAPVRTIAKKLMHCVVSVGILCGSAQNANAAAPPPKKYSMSNDPYIDHYPQFYYGSTSRWNRGYDRYVYFMDNTWFGNHEVWSGYGVWPGNATEAVVQSVFQENIDILTAYGISASAATSETAHKNFYYMFNIINRSIIANPTADVAYAGLKIPNVLARAIQQMAINLTQPAVVLKIDDSAQTPDLRCSATSASASGVTPQQYRPGCCAFVRLVGVFEILYFLQAFVNWSNGNGNNPLWQGASVAATSAILFFAYNYYEATNAIVADQNGNERGQDNVNQGYAVARTGDSFTAGVRAFVQAVANAR